jgi:hypothetical protein
MTPADEKAAKTEPTERQSAGAAASFDNQFELPFGKDASLQPDLHGSEDVQSLLSRHLDLETSASEGRFTIVSTQ